jgi:uncharacterized membrane protein YcaP (DUF421 family)
MGKRQVSELQPYELVIAILISELASLPMQDSGIPLIHGVIPIITLTFLQIITSLLKMKFDKIRILIDGKPAVIIKNGKIQDQELKNQILSINDILEGARGNGFFNINDIEYAILENNGQLSIIPKSLKEPVCREDLNINYPSNSLPVVLIHKGKINYNNLKLINRNEKWLYSLLKDNKIEHVEDIFLGTLDSQNKFFYQKQKKEHPNSKKGDFDI